MSNYYSLSNPDKLLIKNIMNSGLLIISILIGISNIYCQPIKEKFSFTIASNFYPKRDPIKKKLSGEILIEYNDINIAANITYFQQDSNLNKSIKFSVDYLGEYYSLDNHLLGDVELELLKILFKYGRKKLSFIDYTDSTSDYKLKLIQRNISCISKKTINIIGRIEYRYSKGIIDYREISYNGIIKLNSKQHLNKMEIKFITGTPTSACMIGHIIEWRIELIK